jgi:hypothetical protein
MCFETQVKENFKRHGFEINNLASECHKLISKMNSENVSNVKKHYPELLLLAQKFGEAEDLRSVFEQNN